MPKVVLPGPLSRNSNCATSVGFSHTHSFILAAVSPAPHRPLLALETKDYPFVNLPEANP
jgi:hypothetical protein